MLAEAQHHAKLFGLHAEEAGKAPDRQRADQDQRDAHAAEMAARQQLLHAVLTAAQQVFKVRRPRPDRLRALAPWPFRTRAPRASALILPRHQNLSSAGPGTGRPPRKLSPALSGTAQALTTRRQPSKELGLGAEKSMQTLASAVNVTRADDMSHRKSRGCRPAPQDYGPAKPLPIAPHRSRESACRPRCQ